MKWRIREDDRWRDASLEERGEAIESACRAAMQILADAPDREQRLRRQAPLPPASRALIRRLAREHRESQARR